MTGPESSASDIRRHDLIQVCRQYAGLFLTGMAVLLVLIPFGTAGLPGDSVFEVSTTHDQMMFRFINSRFIAPAFCASVLFGAAAGFSMFRFLLSKQQTTFYFSLGIRRGGLAAVRIAAGCAGALLAAFVPAAISLFINRLALHPYTGETWSCLYIASGLFLQMMTAFLISGIACALAGTVREACTYTALLLAGPAGIIFGADRLIHFVWGNPAGAFMYSGAEAGSSSLMKRSMDWDPLTFFFNDLNRYSVFYRSSEHLVPDPLPLWRILTGILFTAALSVLLLTTIKERRAEHAGFSGQNKMMNMILSAVSGFVIFSFVFSLFADSSKLVAAFLGMFAFAAFLTALRIAAGWSDISRKEHMISSAVQLLVCTLICIGFMAAGDKVMSSVPDPSEIKSVSVSSTGSPAYAVSEISGVSSGNGYYVVSSNKFDTPEDISAAVSINRSFSRMGRTKMGTDEDFSKTVVPYDIRFSYTMKNGRRVSRYYDRASLSQLEALTLMEDSETIRIEQQDLIRGTLDTGSDINWSEEAYSSGEIYLADKWFSGVYQIRLTDEARAELMDALAEDLFSQSINDRYFPDEDAEGVLFFTTEGEDDIADFSWHIGNAPVFITRSFKHTLAFLEREGFADCMESEAVIEEVYLQKYDPYSGINGRKTPAGNVFMEYRSDDTDSFIVQSDFGAKSPVTDPDRISRLAEKMRSTYCMTREGYLAAVKMKGSGKYVYKYLPGGSGDVK